jgi:hypothetical protein
MEHKAHSDYGTVLKPTETALVVDEEGEMYLLMSENEEEVLPRYAILLAAVLSRIADEDWIEEMIDEFLEGEDYEKIVMESHMRGKVYVEGKEIK